MLMLEKYQEAFFVLVQAGLWGRDASLSKYDNVNFEDVYRLAQEQSVVGLVVAGLEKVTDIKMPQRAVLTMAGEVLQLEQRNRTMNAFVAELIDKLRKENIYTLLVKGQGIAQCYERPLWRSSGDVDLFLNYDNYKQAIQVLSPLSSNIEEENTYNQHLAMTMNGWLVELHGTLRSCLWKSLDKELDKVQYDVFKYGRVRTWMNGGTEVLLPAPDEDVVFVFSHILEHFFKEGIGLRQICDWCRLLYTYRESLNHELLESRLRRAGVWTEWKVFATLAVTYTGIPMEAMPFYSESSRWKRKSSRVMAFILESGNFGRNRDYSYQKKYPFVLRKAISLWRHIVDTVRYSFIFPLDSLRVLLRRLQDGFIVVAQSKRH